MPEAGTTHAVAAESIAKAGQRPAEPVQRPHPPSLRAEVIGLQRAAGNGAVSSVLQPAAAGPGAAELPDRNGPAGDARPRPLQVRAPGPEALEGLPPVVRGVLQSGGSLLDPRTRGLMETRFGYDFGPVRVHTGAQASESARSVNAAAYTVGRDIVFDDGRYWPRRQRRPAPAGPRVGPHDPTELFHERAPGALAAESLRERRRGMRPGRPVRHAGSPACADLRGSGAPISAPRRHLAERCGAPVRTRHGGRAGQQASKLQGTPC
jgi:hypothetical protein